MGIDKQITGMAGVYYVASELSRKDLIALPTNRNLPGFDIVVSNKNGLKHAFLQVKTSKKKVNFWPIGKEVPEYINKSDKAFYVFVRFNKKDNKYECFVASSKEVVKQVNGYRGDWCCWRLPKGCEEDYRDRWDKLNID